MKSAEHWIKTLNLQPHPEGGYFSETYRATEHIAHNALPPRFSGSRVFSTAIYFLLTSTTISAFHRIQSDELWFFHAGNPLTIHTLSPNGQHHPHIIGPDGPFQIAVPTGHWFGAEVTQDHALVSCTVAPGFDFADFELANRQTLIAQYPQHHALITRLTHS